MKKNIYSLVVACLLVTQSKAQFYVSFTGGYGIAPPGMKLGEKIDLKRVNFEDAIKTPVGNISGSYGAGTNFQIRGGYFFNDRLGLEFALGKVNGVEQTPILVRGEIDKVSAKAVSNTYGLGLSLVCNITKNVYARVGPLMKVGGKTVVNVSARKSLEGKRVKTGNFIFPELPLAKGSYADIKFTQENYGRPPVGFLGAVGYKYLIGSHLEVFGEMEYMNIRVTKDKSKLTAFNLDAYAIVEPPIGETVTKKIPNQNTLDNLPDGASLETVYLDSLTPEEAKAARASNFAAKQLTSSAPYSSIGINIGISYKF